MNLTRLMVLGTLAGQGQLHGHQIRRIAEVSNVGYWGGVSVGALYRELRTMESEGLVEAVRTEQVGRRPARTVYAITDEGRLELTVLRERAITDTNPGQDPIGVALTFTGTGDDLAELQGWLRSRRDRLAIAAGQVADEEDRLTAKGYLDPLSAAVMHRGVMHLETEVRWHDEFAKILAAHPAAEGCPGSGGPGSGGTGASGTGPSGTGPSGTGPSGTGPSGTGASGTGASGTGPSGTGPSGTGPSGPGSGGTGSGGPDPGPSSAGATSSGGTTSGGARSGAPTAPTMGRMRAGKPVDDPGHTR